jgi:hypothetical protein
MIKKNTMADRQRGALSLLRVAVFSAVLAGAAMAAIWSMRHERNLFAEGLDQLGGAPAQQALGSARRAIGSVDTQGGALRKCVIDGKPVVSNTDCKDSNRTSKTIAIHDSHGIEAPKQPVPAKAEPTSNPALDKMIEKQLH